MKTRKPVYLLAGGNYRRRKTPDPLIARVFAESGVPAPAVAYLGAASEDDRGLFHWIKDLFLQSGAARVELAESVATGVDVAATRGVLGTADCVFVSGGDVEAGMNVLQRVRLMPLLQQRYDQGALFFGLSAGSIMLASQWVRWHDADDDGTAEAFPCMGFAPVLCDTHAEEEDWEELRALLSLPGIKGIGYGIPSSGALRVHPDGRVDAYGKPVVRLQRHRSKIVQLDALVPVA